MSWKREAQRVAAEIYGTEPEYIFIEQAAESPAVIVNWQQSMTVSQAVRNQVEDAVRAVLPKRLQRHDVLCV